MFGFRSDGIKLKKIDPIIRFTSYIMPERHDSQVAMVIDVKCDGIDEFITKKSKEGIDYNYNHIISAAVVRTFALRPRLNRFIMSGRVYRRKGIFISFAVKNRLFDDAKETTVKIKFTGHETLSQIKDIFDTEIAKNTKTEENNNTDKLAKGFLKIPHFILKPVLGLLKWADKIGILPKKIIKTSPFHTSCWLTFMKSLGSDFVYHHLYDFGTTGLFVSVGKEKNEAVVDPYGVIKVEKIIKLGLVIDERITDGLYNSKSIKLFKRLMQSPELLEEGLEFVEEDPDA